VLGVHPDASADEVRRAWRRVARTTHPDSGGDEAAFAEALAAYQTLTDPPRGRSRSGAPVVFARRRGARARAARWWRRRRRGHPARVV
jgi:hypothetical protein